MSSEVAKRADFSSIRYAQCWEDADILIAALQPGPGKRCLSIASAGDNTLALLASSPEHVLAVDLSEAQLACLALRVAAYRCLEHRELLQLVGSIPCENRLFLYRACRPHLSHAVQDFWDERSALLVHGIGGIGKFEHYFQLFRTRVLPLVHSHKMISELLQSKSREERLTFYENQWNSRRWRLLFNIFFSRRVMGWLGRSPAFFQYVEGSVAERILRRTRYALTELNTSQNPYLHWILTGTHGQALPFALREENFAPIRANLDRLEWRQCSVEEVLGKGDRYDCFNLSDIFEYMSAESYEALLRLLVSCSRQNARLAYWNMLAPRSRPDSMSASLESLDELSRTLFLEDKAFFYSAFIVERVR